MRAVTLALGLLQLAACAEREIWTGRRCPNGQLECPPEASTQTPFDQGADPDASYPLDAALLDACLGCASADADGAESPRALCVAGNYEGRAAGTYTPGAAGACGLITLFSGTGNGVFKLAIGEPDGSQAPVATSQCDMGWVDDPDAGVEADAAGEGMPATAKASRALLIGSLDCTTGKLSAELRGSYRSDSLCTLGLFLDDYFYKGRVEAQFDRATLSFDGGTVVREPGSVLGPAPGGQSTFFLKRVGEPGPLDAPDQDCYGGKRFPEELFPEGGL